MRVYALWDCPSGMLERFLREAVRVCTGVLERCIEDTTREQMLWVDFEALQTDPERVLRQILQFTGPHTSDRPDANEHAHAADIERALSSVPIHRGERAAMPDDESVLQLDRVMRAARQRFGETDG